MSEVKGLGFIPSPNDRRNLMMSAFLPTFPIPEKKDYTEEMTPVGDQGEEGACVGFAVAIGLKEYQEKKEHQRHIPLSPRFVYEEARKIDGFPDHEQGTSCLAAMKVLEQKGVCEWDFWPYDVQRVGEPKPGTEENAKQYRIQAYGQLDSLETMKRSLVVDGPFVAGVPVYENWRTQEVWGTGKIPAPPENENPIGGHAICMVGYDDDTQLFKFKNSWGPRWGENGYGYLPYQYMELEYSEAFSATDLIGNPNDLIRAKERVLEKLGEDFIENQPGKAFENTSQKVTYH